MTPTLKGTRRDALHDQAVLRSIRMILHDKLRDGVMACYAEARDLKGLDADEVMEAVNKYFGPTGAYQADMFTDAFYEFDGALEDATAVHKFAAE